jgi:hypothetical protein
MASVTFHLPRIVFDHRKIEKAVERSAVKPIKKSLSTVQQEIMFGYKRRNRVSRPGESPSIHSSDPQRSLLNVMFAYDERTKSGVVGPVKISTSKSGGSKALPGLLEHGGTDTVGRGRNKKRVRVGARPNVRPALRRQINAGKIVTPWSNVVRG